MRRVKLHFPDSNHLAVLLRDIRFLDEINYLNYNLLGNNNIVLNDPVTQHYWLDSELVILSIFSRAIQRIIFPTSLNSVEFLNPFLGQQKGGLIHDGQVIIDTTDIDVFGINITESNL